MRPKTKAGGRTALLPTSKQLPQEDEPPKQKGLHTFEPLVRVDCKKCGFNKVEAINGLCTGCATALNIVIVEKGLNSFEEAMAV